MSVELRVSCRKGGVNNLQFLAHIDFFLIMLWIGGTLNVINVTGKRNFDNNFDFFIVDTEICGTHLKKKKKKSRFFRSRC